MFTISHDVSTGAFRLYDVDNDGYITRDEMYNIVDAIYQMVVSISNMYIRPFLIHFTFFIRRGPWWCRGVATTFKRNGL